MAVDASGKKGAVLLVTAFEPFDGAEKNASMILLEKLENMGFEGKIAFLGPIPVSFKDAWPAVESVLKNNPDIEGVIALGQAEGRSRISLERVAINTINARIPDNSGVIPPEGHIDAAAPPALWTSFPWHTAPKSDDWQCSYSAGTYVCNTLMFQLLSWAKGAGKMAGFIHVPLLASQDAKLETTPRMDDDVAAEALAKIIRFSLDSMEAKNALVLPPVQKPPKAPGI